MEIKPCPVCGTNTKKDPELSERLSLFPELVEALEKIRANRAYLYCGLTVEEWKNLKELLVKAKALKE